MDISSDAQTTPSKPGAPLTPLPLAAAKLIATQLNKKPANLNPSVVASPVEWECTDLKNATLEMDLSSYGVRDDANMDRSIAGVTGNRRGA